MPYKGNISDTITCQRYILESDGSLPYLGYTLAGRLKSLLSFIASPTRDGHPK